MRTVLAYDVTSDKRRARFFRAMRQHLTPVQKSVFEGHLDAAGMAAVEAVIAEELDLTEDQVLVYGVCGSCSGLVRRHGVARTVPDPDEPIIL